MTQYYTDFSEYSTGTFPQSGDDWTREDSDSGDPFSIESDASSAGGQKLDVTSGFSEHQVISWDSKDAADQEVVALYEHIADNGDFQLVRGSYDANGLDAYAGSHSTNVTDDPTQIYLRKVTDGSGGYIEFGDGNAQVSQLTWFRLRVNGATLKIRAWNDGDSEPGTWAVEGTDSDYGSGFVGLGHDGVNHEYAIHEYGVGTEGDTAPTSAVGGSAPNAPSNLSATLQ